MSASRIPSTLETPIISLMWPDSGTVDKLAQAAWGQDLDLDGLARAFSSDTRYRAFIQQTLTTLVTDAGVITWRQAVLSDFLSNPVLVERLSMLLPRLAEMTMRHARFGNRRYSTLFEVADRLAELDLYLGVVRELFDALNAVEVKSEGLRQLHQNLLGIITHETFQALRAELPELQRPLQNFASITIGINLDSGLRPVSAVLLSVNERPFQDARSLLSKLLGIGSADADETGIAPLHFTPSDAEQRPLSTLFQDLERLIAQTVQPVARALSRYVRINSKPLAGLEKELAFYTSAVSLIRRLQARGVAFCQPEIAPVQERVSTVGGLVNIHLALRDAERPLVRNDLIFDHQGRIAILTGPNSGGKTTYLQAVGLIHVLFQAGLFIPAEKARLSPVDAIFTHFPALESQQGRLSEEAARLRHICLNTTQYSLVLLNESLSSTTANEALYLAQDLLAGLRAIGVRAIYATHLVELAEHLDEIEATVEGESALYSLVAGIQMMDGEAATDLRIQPTFQIARGLPQGRSYAREIARRHGISLEQILESRRDATRSS
jgi:DNA mismatch repair protein MutS